MPEVETISFGHWTQKPLYTPVTGSSRTVVLEENVDWKDIIWGLERVRINKRLIHLRYLVFYPNS